MIFDIDTGRYIEFVDFINKHLEMFTDYCESMILARKPSFLFGNVSTGKSCLIDEMRRKSRLAGWLIDETYSLYGSDINSRVIRRECKSSRDERDEGRLLIFSITNRDQLKKIKEFYGYDVYMLHGIK